MKTGQSECQRLGKSSGSPGFSEYPLTPSTPSWGPCMGSADTRGASSKYSKHVRGQLAGSTNTSSETNSLQGGQSCRGIMCPACSSRDRRSKARSQAASLPQRSPALEINPFFFLSLQCNSWALQLCLMEGTGT